MSDRDELAALIDPYVETDGFAGAAADDILARWRLVPVAKSGCTCKHEEWHAIGCVCCNR